MRTIILGIGNPLLGDDGVGIRVAKELRKHVKDPDVEVDETTTGGINLLDQIIGFDKAILVDTIKDKSMRNGEIKRLTLGDLSSYHSFNPHDVGLPEACKLAKRLGETRIPHDITIFGIAVNKMQYEFWEGLSEEISKTVPKTVDMIMSELNHHKNQVEEI
ncbi:MAG: hydrogenase maturation protease [Candidatus Thermoplasmatota archaeon]|jgi:hydrogenase maturation protease|nr:hydrogenase maturation protease [Candidatus Thermoplasmatota archaeon]